MRSRFPHLRAILILLALVLAPLTVLIADPGRLAAWQSCDPQDLSAWPEIEQTAKELERGWIEHEARSQINRDLVAGLATGRLKLSEAVDLYWANNREVQGFRDLIDQTWVGDIQVAARLNLLRLVRLYVQREVGRDDVTPRLIAEYEGTYGAFPLSGPDALDQW